MKVVHQKVKDTKTRHALDPLFINTLYYFLYLYTWYHFYTDWAV